MLSGMQTTFVDVLNNLKIMKSRHYLTIVLLAFLFSVLLGMIDYETRSLYHLFTGDGGSNFLVLLLYTSLFSLIGIGMIKMGRLFMQLCQN